MGDRERTILASVLLAIVTFFCYWGTYHNGFITVDDPLYVMNNPAVQTGLTWKGIVTVFTTVSFTYWQPVAYLSHMVDVELFGLNPGPQHLVSVALHCISSVLLFLALLRLTGAMYRSLFVAALFALHPMHVEPVAWIASRKDVLSGFFFIAGLLAYSRYHQNRTGGRLFWVCLAFALGLMAKPQILAFPLILMLLDFWPLRWKGRQTLVEKIPLFALAGISLMVTLSSVAYTGKLSGDVHVKVTNISRLGTAATTIGGYLPKFFWPDHLSIFYVPAHLTSSAVWAVICVLVIAGISIAAYRFRARVPYFFVGWFWFLLTLLPTTGLLMADRFSYIPFIGLSITIVWGVAELCQPTRNLPWVAVAAGVGVIGIFGLLVKQRVETWRTTDSVFTAALAEDPANFQIHNWRGTAYLHANRFQEAVSEFETSLRFRSEQFLAEMNMARACRGAGMADNAIRHFTNASAIRPTDPLPDKEMGDLLLSELRFKEALASFKKARDLQYHDMQSLTAVIRSLEAVAR